MITLYQTPPAWGLTTFSPFCLKVETYLRMVDLPYEVRAADIRKAPMGKIPWIEEDGAIIADSSDILAHLKKKHGDPLDSDLDARGRALSLVLQRMIEEHTYFAVAWLRWNSEAAQPFLREALAPVAPKLLLGFIVRSIRKSINKTCHGQGISRHGEDGLLIRVQADLDALSTMLGSQRFFLGETPRTIDAVMYGFLTQIHSVPWTSKEKTYVRSLKNLSGFCKRITELYFTDTDSTADTIDATGLGAVVSAIAATKRKESSSEGSADKRRAGSDDGEEKSGSGG